jgi:hypothetical protein
MHNVIFSEYEHVRKSSKSGRFPALPRRHYLGLNAESVAMLEVPEVRERMGALLAEHGWSRRTRRLRAIELELLKAPFLLSHPSLLLRRRVPHWRRTWRAFPTPEDALGRFHAGPRPPLAYVEELWPLLRPRGGARELPLP